MIRSVGWRLALLNAVVVTLVIAAVAGLSFLFSSRNLQGELDQNLRDRAQSAQLVWGPALSGPGPLPTPAPAPTAAASEKERHDAEEERHHAEESLIESGDEFLFVVDAAGRLVESPVAFPMEELPYQAGIDRALRGETDLRDVRFDDDATLRMLTEPVREGGRVIGDLQVGRGTVRHELQVRLIGWGTLAAGALGLVIAVPAGLFLARRAMAPIEAAFARQRAFVADASHELRSPLAVIRANAELAQRLAPPRSEVREELGAVIEEVDQMSRLVDDLLFLARVDADRVVMALERCDLAAVVRGAAEPMAALAAKAGVRLFIKTPAAVAVDGDADQLRRVVRNLVDNAIRHTPADGSVRVAVETDGGRAVVRVVDTGTGIGLAEQERIFERFYRPDGARSRASGGAGLGLAIARAIVVAHGGKIGLESKPGHGATAWFSLPLATPSAARSDHPPRRADAAGPAPDRPPVPAGAEPPSA